MKVSESEMGEGGKLKGEKENELEKESKSLMRKRERMDEKERRQKLNEWNCHKGGGDDCRERRRNDVVKMHEWEKKRMNVKKQKESK